MEARHGTDFSERSWTRLLSTRPIPDAPITFAELEVQLCDRMLADVKAGATGEITTYSQRANAGMLCIAVEVATCE